MAQSTPSTTSSSTLSISSSTPLSLQVITITVVALTTTFTPPPSCMDMHLTQLASPGYQIWLNEPNPVPNSKFGDCYPSQFIRGYISIVNASSSIAPMFSPLVCPSGWSTAREWENGYIACCASGFLLHPPDTTVDTDRPGYGGTCYSNFELGQTVNVTAYDSTSVTATAQWVASTDTDQAYGHPIDGFKVEAVAPTVALESTLSVGAIAGIVIGAVASLFCFMFLICLHRKKRKAAVAQSGHSVITQKELPVQPGGKSGVTTPGSYEYSATARSPPHELDVVPMRGELDGQGTRGELEGGWSGNELKG